MPATRHKPDHRIAVVSAPGYTKYGYNKSGYDKDGYHQEGYHKEGYDNKGYDKYGYDRHGYGETGEPGSESLSQSPTFFFSLSFPIPEWGQ
jgi:hypothetical protein